MGLTVMNQEKELKEAKLYLKSFIEAKVLLREDNSDIPVYALNGDPMTNVVDFRVAFSHREFMENVSKLFWSFFDEKKTWQIGGMETTALCLSIALMLAGQNASSFYIRKSRKKYGTLRQIEGEIDTESDNLILVDDNVASGGSILKQIKILEEEKGVTPKAVFTIFAFNAQKQEEKLKEMGIDFYYIFAGEEFGFGSKMSKPFMVKKPTPVWSFSIPSPHFLEQGIKHTPLIDGDDIIVPTDNGIIHRLRQDDGTTVWKRKVLMKVKNIFTTFPSSCINGHNIFLTTYNGQIISLGLKDGKPNWRHNITGRFTAPIVSTEKYLILSCQEGVGRGTYSIQLFDLEQTKITFVSPLKAKVTGNIVVSDDNQQVYFADANNTVHSLNLETKDYNHV